MKVLKILHPVDTRCSHSPGEAASHPVGQKEQRPSETAPGAHGAAREVRRGLPTGPLGTSQESNSGLRNSTRAERKESLDPVAAPVV